MNSPRPSPPGEQAVPDSVPLSTITPVSVPSESAALAADRERLQQAEQQQIDRERQEELARQRELARFD